MTARGVVAALILPVACVAADYKSGIDLTLSGAEGVDWYEEVFYYDPLVNDRSVIYILDTTDIALAHNARNSQTSANNSTIIIGANGLDTTPDSGDEGVIRYRVDGDWHWGPLWSAASQNPAYSAPFAFEDLNYTLYGDAGVSVVGATGDNGVTLSLATKGSYYYRGVADSVGDEWHTITVADDDVYLGGDTEFHASDGKMHVFVVNPLTPCIKISVTGDAQFYTTPAKHYFDPKIHDQTTYIDGGTGDIDLEIRDINGNNVFYRIGGGAFTDAGAATVTLDEADFSNGSNTLEYYYAGNASYTKTRTVVKVDRATSTDFPSDGETHGHLLTGSAAMWSQIQSNISSFAAFGGWMDNWRTNDFWNEATNFVSLMGQGNRMHTDALKSAFLAKHDGNAAFRTGESYTFAALSKFALLEMETAIDPVGYELTWPFSAIPARDYIYRGYYDALPMQKAAFAYDILIDQFKSTDHADGITPIEDYYMRDLLAYWVFLTTRHNGNYDPSATATGPGIWDTAKKVASATICLALPSYSTPYFGTCGIDGNTTTYAGVPFPSGNFTWHELYLDDAVATPGFPNNANGMGIEGGIITAEGNFDDSLAYYSDNLLGYQLTSFANLLKLHYPQKTLPTYEQSLLNAANGTITGAHTIVGPQRFPVYLAINERFPAAAAINLDYLRLDDGDGVTENELILQMQVLGVAWYDPYWTPSGAVGIQRSIDFGGGIGLW